MVSWFKQEFRINNERNLAEERNLEPEALLDELVQSVPPGFSGSHPPNPIGRQVLRFPVLKRKGQ